MVGYLTEYGRLKLFTFHWSVEEFASASLQLCNAWIASDLLTCPFSSSTHPSAHTPKTFTFICLLITYTLSSSQNRYLRPWSRIFQHYIKHRCSPIHQKQRNKPCFKSLVFFFINILPILHPLNMFIIIMFCLCPHESVRI